MASEPSPGGGAGLYSLSAMWLSVTVPWAVREICTALAARLVSGVPSAAAARTDRRVAST